MAIGQKNIVDMGPGKDKPSDDSGTSKPKPSAAATQAADRADRDLRSRLETIFERIADAADARGDEELADIVRDDVKVMANGLVSLTRPMRALRAPLLLLLAVVEPVMAFSRVTRVIVGRYLDRRSERQTTVDTPAP